MKRVAKVLVCVATSLVAAVTVTSVAWRELQVWAGAGILRQEEQPARDGLTKSPEERFITFAAKLDVAALLLAGSDEELEARGIRPSLVNRVSWLLQLPQS